MFIHILGYHKVVVYMMLPRGYSLAFVLVFFPSFFYPHPSPLYFLPRNKPDNPIGC